jgi:DNA-binding CsgD family transcriptional regulator
MSALPDICPDYIESTLPRKPYCSDDLETGLVIRPKELALKKAYISPNHPYNRQWLVFDVDRDTDGGLDWIERGVAPPNFAVVNPDNGHAHYVYMLTTPVYMQNGTRQRPKAYLRAIEDAMTEALGADKAYSKLITKNPFAGRWRYIPYHHNTYSLKELAAGLKLKKAPYRQRINLDAAEGRNCALFQALRYFAYAEVYKRKWSFNSWQQHIAGRAKQLNSELCSQEQVALLAYSEVMTIARSVAKWTASNLGHGFKNWGDARRQKSLATRQAQAAKLRETIYKLKAERPHLSNRALARLASCSETTVRNALKQLEMPSKTAQNQAQSAQFVISDDSPLRDCIKIKTQRGTNTNEKPNLNEPNVRLISVSKEKGEPPMIRLYTDKEVFDWIKSGQSQVLMRYFARLNPDDSITVQGDELEEAIIEHEHEAFKRWLRRRSRNNAPTR